MIRGFESLIMLNWKRDMKGDRVNDRGYQNSVFMV